MNINQNVSYRDIMRFQISSRRVVRRGTLFINIRVFRKVFSKQLCFIRWKRQHLRVTSKLVLFTTRRHSVTRKDLFLHLQVTDHVRESQKKIGININCSYHHSHLPNKHNGSAQKKRSLFI